MCDNFVFVYGTLKKGFWNHHMLEGSKFVGKAKTKEKYALYIDNIPYLVKTEKVSHVSGEVYEVNKKSLLSLDGLEGHPVWYYRELSQVIFEDGRELNAWIYFYPEKLGVLLSEGNYYKEKKYE